MIFVYITCKNKAEAKKIGLSLIKKRLAACCNIFPIDSIYWWSSSAKASEDKQNKIVEDKETVLIVKTIKRNFKKVERETKRLHSYKVPCILEIPINRASSQYLSWLKKETKQ